MICQLEQIANLLVQRDWSLVTAESCTGGGLSRQVTSVPGSSVWFDRGFVTYSNAAKQELLDVPENMIEEYGAVSEEVVVAMARGALAHSRAQLAVAVTGIAGPDGGSEEKPVGTVWFAWVIETKTSSRCRLFEGDREAIRRQSEEYAIEGMLELLNATATQT